MRLWRRALTEPQVLPGTTFDRDDEVGVGSEQRSGTVDSEDPAEIHPVIGTGVHQYQHEHARRRFAAACRARFVVVQGPDEPRG